MNGRSIARALVLLLTGLVKGCGPAAMDDPIVVMLDRRTEPGQRVTAVEQLGSVAGHPEPTRYLEALHEVAWSARHPDRLRAVAIDRLIEYDPIAFCRVADQRIVNVERWAVLQHIFDCAVQYGLGQFTATVVRSYARESQIYADDQRPEYRVLAALNPGRTVEDVIFEMFIGLEPGHEIVHQVAAWTLLNRLVTPASARAMVQSSPPATALVLDLQAAAEVLGMLPPNREGVLWLIHVRRGPGQQFWIDGSARAARLTPTQRVGLELRHLPLLGHRSAHQLSLDRAALIERIGRHLAASHHVSRIDDRGKEPTGESLAADRLAWADLAAIDLLLELMKDRVLVADWFTQADADCLDQSSEFGGVLRHDGHRFTAEPFPPLFRAHDRKFYSSPSLIEAMYTAVAHYHFHAQHHRNAPFAGPGEGDRAFANRLRPTALVLTFIDRDTLNVDYYQAGGVVIDLGMIHR